MSRLRNLPPHGYDQNQIWCEIVALACELLARTAILALRGTARRSEPKKLLFRLFSVAGRIVRGSRRLRLRLPDSRATSRLAAESSGPRHIPRPPAQGHESSRLGNWPMRERLGAGP